MLWQRVQRPVLYGLKEWLLWLTLDTRTSVTVYNCRHEKYKERVRGETGKRNFCYCHNWLFQPLIFVFFKSRALCSALWRLQNAIFLHFHFLNRGLTALSLVSSWTAHLILIAGQLKHRLTVGWKKSSNKWASGLCVWISVHAAVMGQQQHQENTPQYHRENSEINTLCVCKNVWTITRKEHQNKTVLKQNATKEIESQNDPRLQKHGGKLQGVICAPLFHLLHIHFHCHYSAGCATLF